jgi:hypothetical protein
MHLSKMVPVTFAMPLSERRLIFTRKSRSCEKTNGDNPKHISNHA